MNNTSLEIHTPSFANGDAQAAFAAMEQESTALQTTTDQDVIEMVADWLAPQYALAARARLAAETDLAQRLKILRRFVFDWALLRRSQQYSERLDIARDRLELATQRSKEQMEAVFKVWMKRPENQYRPPKLSQAEKERKMMAVFGLTKDHHIFHGPNAKDPRVLDEDFEYEDEEEEEEGEETDNDDQTSDSEEVEDSEDGEEGEDSEGEEGEEGEEGDGGEDGEDAEDSKDKENSDAEQPEEEQP